MPQKKKVKKTVIVKPQTNKDSIQINIKKTLDDDKKIKPEKVFEGYKKTK
jgi:Holliday junction resolvasome RuvABC endonuclease subunit